MGILLTVLARTVLAALYAVNTAMFLRVIMSWFSRGEDNRFTVFLAVVTEPFVIPFRILFSRFEAIQNSPFDIPFFVAYLVTSMLPGLLPAV